MANKWGIPSDIEFFVKERDKNCVYCRVEFKETNDSRKFNPSWEHIVNDIRINGKENIALCCISCNASKGAKLIEDWLQSEYCKRKKITIETVAPVVKDAIVSPPKIKNN